MSTKGLCPCPSCVARPGRLEQALSYRSESEKEEGFVHLHTSMSSPATRWDSVWIRDSLEARNSTARSHTRFIRRLQWQGGVQQGSGWHVATFPSEGGALLSSATLTQLQRAEWCTRDSTSLSRRELKGLAVVALSSMWGLCPAYQAWKEQPCSVGLHLIGTHAG